MIFIGLFIIYISIKQQIFVINNLGNKVMVQGRVANVFVCNAEVDFIDSSNQVVTVMTDNSCDGSSLFYSPKIGDKADVIFDPKNPNNGEVIKIYSNDIIHVFTSWRIKNVINSLFGLGFIVMAFIPKKFK